VSNNQLSVRSETISNLTALTTLWLYGNGLLCLPENLTVTSRG